MTRPEMSAEALLFTMGGAMLAVTLVASITFVIGSIGWLLVAYGVLIALAIVVGVFTYRFIDADH